MFCNLKVMLHHQSRSQIFQAVCEHVMAISGWVSIPRKALLTAMSTRSRMWWSHGHHGHFQHSSLFHSFLQILCLFPLKKSVMLTELSQAHEKKCIHYPLQMEAKIKKRERIKRNACIVYTANTAYCQTLFISLSNCSWNDFVTISKFTLYLWNWTSFHVIIAYSPCLFSCWTMFFSFFYLLDSIFNSSILLLFAVDKK